MVSDAGPQLFFSRITERNQRHFCKTKAAGFLASLPLLLSVALEMKVFRPVTDGNICIAHTSLTETERNGFLNVFPVHMAKK